MSDFLAAVGLLFIFEGLLYGGFPAAAKRLAIEVTGLPEQMLRMVGLASMLFGLAIIWLVRG
jgi:uncharacterized protein YjeT (DUF2065 family)